MKYVGFSLIILGVLALVVLFLLHLTTVNAFLLASLLTIIIGVCLMVWGMKRESRY